MLRKRRTFEQKEKKLQRRVAVIIAAQHGANAAWWASLCCAPHPALEARAALSIGVTIPLAVDQRRGRVYGDSDKLPKNFRIVAVIPNVLHSANAGWRPIRCCAAPQPALEAKGALTIIVTIHLAVGQRPLRAVSQINNMAQIPNTGAGRSHAAASRCQHSRPKLNSTSLSQSSWHMVNAEAGSIPNFKTSSYDIA